ncbi:hypothetical protein [Dipodfec virus UOA04_Rod_707]|nr:hypothetical protein [Dipodfec virus UOA04_Rod_707]
MSKRVQSNLLQQNVFVREAVNLLSLQPAAQKTYETLDEVISDDGVKLVSRVVDYPITPEYVSSFADGCDYRLDPFAAANRPAVSKNLGDIRGTQELSNMDTEALLKYTQDLLTRVQAAQQNKIQVENQTNNTEVNNG